LAGFKFIKSLIGIETVPLDTGTSSESRFKFIKSLIGIETLAGYQGHKEIARFKFIKSLIGIETREHESRGVVCADSNSSNP